MAETEGSPRVLVGMIDGPVDVTHPDLAGAPISSVGTGTGAACRVSGSEACHHGTFVAGILAARRGGQAPAICPGCPLRVRPIFCEAATIDACPVVTADELAQAVAECVDAGVKVLNMSLGLTSSTLADAPALREALGYAAGRGVLLVAAAGNGGGIGPVPLFRHPAVLPVAACDAAGRPLPTSNLGVGVGRGGLLAPGTLRSTVPGGGYRQMSGTSAAAALVSGAAALLWSLHPGAPAAALRSALLRPGTRRGSIVPPLLDVAQSRAALAAAHPQRIAR
ncbi:MAG TPA: S8 family serine peptidase [Longimicrobium sp.]